MSSANTNFLQLPILDTFEPLTKGTNLPSVPLEPSPTPSSHNSVKDFDTATTKTATDATTPPRSPVSPASPTRPGSMRRFLSRVSLNSTYDKEAAPPMSPTESIMSVGRTASTASKKTSWWRRGKDKSGTSALSKIPTNQPPQTIAQKIVPTRPLTPPPKLPEMNGSSSTFGDDMFNFK